MLPTITAYQDFFVSAYEDRTTRLNETLELMTYDKDLIKRLTKLAQMVWEDFMHDFRQVEYRQNIPYELQESAKLYALDLLVIADSLNCNDENLLRRISLIYLIFYLNIHYFDDHVEDPEKFHSKFSYDATLPTETQHGAAPFSFQLGCIQLLEKNLSSLTAHHGIVDTHLIRNSYLRNMTNMTLHLVKERSTSLSYTTVIQVKNHGIFNAWADFTATLIGVFHPQQSDSDRKTITEALCSIGSLTQITDDLRDIQKDRALGNINIFTAALSANHQSEAFRSIAQVYYNEEQSCVRSLRQFVPHHKLQNILFIPFYPFTISKTRQKDVL